MRILLMGAPGSGKGTQSTLLSRALGTPAISTGDIFRDHVRRGTPLGREVEATMAGGGYVPDSVTNALIETRLHEPDARNGFILDGYPRTAGQVDELDRILSRSGSVLDVVVHLSLPTDELVARLESRGVESGRADDDRGAIHGRIATYERVTRPLLDLYRARGILAEIDGSGEATVIAAELARVLVVSSHTQSPQPE